MARKLFFTLSAACLFLLCSISSYGAGKTVHPKAEIKVEYTYHEKFWRGSDGVIERAIPMLLLANNESSKFYCPNTEYRDSLESTPSGRAKARKILHSALRQYSSSGDRAVLDDIIAYKTFLYVFKDVPKSLITVYDKAGLTDFGCYTEPLDAQLWQIGDSVKTVLGYECIVAEADYHGRHWTAWFAPDIPVPDGPWKLRGLPGLILEASEPGDQHYFLAKGIETSHMDIVPIYPSVDYERMTRKELLKGRRNSLENGMAIFRAQTGVDLGVNDTPVSDEGLQYDFLETDYH